jgi:hypothetical protein
VDGCVEVGCLGLGSTSLVGWTVALLLLVCVRYFVVLFFLCHKGVLRSSEVCWGTACFRLFRLPLDCGVEVVLRCAVVGVSGDVVFRLMLSC